MKRSTLQVFLNQKRMFPFETQTKLTSFFFFFESQMDTTLLVIELKGHRLFKAHTILSASLA